MILPYRNKKTNFSNNNSLNKDKKKSEKQNNNNNSYKSQSTISYLPNLSKTGLKKLKLNN